MFKLLSEEVRKEAMKEYVLRRGVVMLTAFVLVIIVAMVGLFPSYILSNARQKELALGVDVLENLAPEENQEDLQSWLSDMNQKLRLLSPNLDKDRPTLLMEQVVREKGSGISLTGLEWLKSSEEVTLAVTGIARDRQSLLSFESRLNASGHFSIVSLPVSNLAKERDISFRVKLSPKKSP